MFIFTAKLNKKRAVIAILLLGIVLCAIIVFAASSKGAYEVTFPPLAATVKNNNQRVDFLNSLGWEVSDEAIEEEDIIIPREFPDVYKNYNEIQLNQGFDLKEYSGMEAKRYTYKILNHPTGDKSVVADLIVYHNQIIAGNVQSTAVDGFMHGLEMPK